MQKMWVSNIICAVIFFIGVMIFFAMNNVLCGVMYAICTVCWTICAIVEYITYKKNRR